MFLDWLESRRLEKQRARAQSVVRRHENVELNYMLIKLTAPWSIKKRSNKPYTPLID